MWGDNPYADLRRELCSWCAEWLRDNAKEIVK
jgi:hypothetical protein